MNKAKELQGLCASCLHYGEDCAKRDKEIKEVVKHESLPGIFNGNRCLKCRFHKLEPLPYNPPGND